nr:MAG TPA: hypothetical protein [Caudoviricetes sp.]
MKVKKKPDIAGKSSNIRLSLSTTNERRKLYFAPCVSGILRILCLQLCSQA